MRTTLTLEADVAGQIAELARHERVSFKTIVNRTLRLGLRDSEIPEPVFLIAPYRGELRPGIDDRKLNELAWE